MSQNLIVFSYPFTNDQYSPLRVGSIFRKRRLVSLYATVLAIHLGFHVVTGAINLYVLFKNTTDAQVQQCVNDANSKLNTDGTNITKAVCEKAVTFARGLTIVAFILVCLVELCTPFRFFFFCFVLTLFDP